MWEVFDNQINELGVFTSEYYSNHHMPPTVNSSGNQLHIDVKADKVSILYARYYTQKAIDEGIVSVCKKFTLTKD